MSFAAATPLSIGEQAYRRLRADIVFGRIAPGERLRLDQMKQQCEVGVGTLREILTRLAAEGLVLSEGQRGFAVPTVTAGNLRELADLRLVLEGRALALSFATGDIDWEGRVVAAHHKLEVAEWRRRAGEGDAEIWKRYEGEFHQALISGCGSGECLRPLSAVSHGRRLFSRRCRGRRAPCLARLHFGAQCRWGADRAC